MEPGAGAAILSASCEPGGGEEKQTPTCVWLEENLRNRSQLYDNSNRIGLRASRLLLLVILKCAGSLVPGSRL